MWWVVVEVWCGGGGGECTIAVYYASIHTTITTHTLSNHHTHTLNHHTHRIRHADSAPQLQASSLSTAQSWEDICTWVLGVSRYNMWDVLLEGAFMTCVQQRIDGWMEGVAQAVLQPMTACFEVCFWGF